MSANASLSSLRETLAALPNATRQQLTCTIEAGLPALDAVVAFQLGPHPDPDAPPPTAGAEWEAWHDDRAADIATWADVTRPLRAVILDLEHLAGRRWVPPALQGILDLGHNCRSGATPFSGPAALVIPAWEGLARQTHQQALSALEALRDAATDETVCRPEAPTADYCLLDGFRVRWKNETELQRTLWRCLKLLLSQERYPIQADALHEGVWGADGTTSKNLSNTLNKLNTALLPVAFPWTWHLRGEHIYHEG